METFKRNQKEVEGGPSVLSESMKAESPESPAGGVMGLGYKGVKVCSEFTWCFLR